MEQQGSSTETVANVQIPGVPSDASGLNFLRKINGRYGIQKWLAFKAQTDVRITNTEPPEIGDLDRDVTRSKSPTIERRTDVEPAQLSLENTDTAIQQPVATSNGTTTRTEPDLLTKNDRIRRVLEMVNWTKLRRDTVQEVARFQEPEFAETKFQEFESFIRAEGRNLGLPEGCKPFERVLVHGPKSGSRPCPYILFTNFRTEEDVRKYHAALSKRKVRQEYHPPLRLCYELQKLKYPAAKADLYLEGDPDDTLCGKIAIIEAGHTRRAVTIGGVVQIDDKLYAMTSAHSATEDDDLAQSPRENSSTGSSFDDSEYDDDIESALICGGPHTTSDAQSQPHQGFPEKHLQDDIRSGTLKFQGSSMMGDDWSLHLIENPLLALPNSFPGAGEPTTAHMTRPASHPVSGNVWLLAGVSGFRMVTMLPGTVNFPLPSGNWIRAWKVSLRSSQPQRSPSHLSTSLQHGDSGSWVVDPTNGEVFGHVIASTDVSAFLLPLIDTFSAISTRPELKGSQATISVPPAFDMLANLAHVYGNIPTQNGRDRSRKFASQALMPSTLSQSSTSKVAPIIDSCLKSHQNLHATITKVLQSFLIQAGADMTTFVAETWRNGSAESLFVTMEDAPGNRQAIEIVLRDLAVGLNILPPGSPMPSEKTSGMSHTPMSSKPIPAPDDRLAANLLPEDRKPSSQLPQAQSMTEASSSSTQRRRVPLVFMSKKLENPSRRIVNEGSLEIERAPTRVPSEYRQASGHKAAQATKKDSSGVKGSGQGIMEAGIADIGPENELRGVKLVLVYFAICICEFHISLDSTLIATAVPTITTEFHSVRDIGWYSAAFMLAMATSHLLVGKIYTLFPKKRSYLLYLFVFELGNLVCALAPSSHALIAGRAVAGLGAPGVLVGGFTILAAIVPAHGRDASASILISMTLLARLVAPVLAGALTQHASWRWCFYIQLAMGVTGAVILVFLVRIKPSTTETEALIDKLKDLDGLGLCLFAGSITMLLFALQWGGSQYPWSSSVVIGLFVGAGAVLVLFILWTLRRGDLALVPPALWKVDRNPVLLCAAAFFIVGPFQTIVHWLPIWFQGVLGDKPLASGVNYYPTAISDVVTFIATSVFISRLLPKNIFLLLSGAMISISGGLLTTLYPDIPGRYWIGFQILGGIGSSLSTMSNGAMLFYLPRYLMRLGSSTIFAVTLTSCAIFIAISQAVFNQQLEANFGSNEIIDAGVTGLRSVITASELPEVIDKYNKAVTRIWYIVAFAPIISFILVLGCKWMPMDREHYQDASNREAEREKHAV